MFTKALRTGLHALLLTTLVACASSAADDQEDADPSELATKSGQVQMNDVSVLLPLAKSEDEMAGYLSASSNGAFGTLLPAKLFTDATGIPKTRPSSLPPGADSTLYWDELRVVAFRIDPCFANIGPIQDPSSCKNQLRLVFQAVQYTDGSAGVVDGAVHAFYSLTRDELVELVKDIVALRKSDSSKALGPIAVHPLVAKEGLTGKMAKGLADLVLKHAGEQKLTRFTKFSPGNTATRWDFAGFDVNNGKAKPMKIPTLPGNATSVTFFVGFSQDYAGGFTPETNADDDMQLLGNYEKAKAASKTAQQKAFDAALRIENPDKHSPDTIDCASCHVADNARAFTGKKLGLSAEDNDNAFKPDSKFVSAGDMKQTTPPSEDTRLNFHAFSYRDNHPMIAQRVINETASIVAYLNGVVLK